MAALREHRRREETVLEEQSWRQDPGGRNSDTKRKREEKAITKPRKQTKVYTAEEKAAYKLQREKERQGAKPAPTKKKVVNTNWKMVHQGIKHLIVKDRKNAKQCTRCGVNRHTCAECYLPIQVAAMERSGTRGQRTCEKKPQRQWRTGPIDHLRPPQTAAVNRPRLPEPEPRVNQIEQPLAWDFSEMETT